MTFTPIHDLANYLTEDPLLGVAAGLLLLVFVRWTTRTERDDPADVVDDWRSDR